MAPSEAKVVTGSALEAADPDTTVMVGVGHDVASAREAANDARVAGAAMIMVHQPVHPYVSVDGWIEYHRAIASEVPELGVVLYVRNETIPGSAFARLGEACPNVVGVKYAVPSPARFAAVAADAGVGRFAWVAGLAELHAPGYFAVGATGFTSGLANVDPADVAAAVACPGRRSQQVLVNEIWQRVRPFEELRAANASANNVSVVKEALCQLGICARDVRPPSSLLPTGGRAAVDRDPRAAGACSDDGGTRQTLRSSQLVRGRGLRAFSHRPRARQLGIGAEELAGKPLIGILNTWSDINPCHMHLRERAAGGQARRLGGRRVPRRDARRHALGNLPEADADAVPEPARDGHRGDTALLPLRRGRPHGRLRQVHAGAPDGGGKRGQADHLPTGRPDAHRPLARTRTGQWNRHVAFLGREARRDDKRGGVGHARGRDGALTRPVHDDGYRLDYDCRGGVTGTHSAGRVLHPGSRLSPSQNGRRERVADRRHGSGEPEDVPDRRQDRAFLDAVTVVLALGGSTNAVIHLVAMAGRCGVELSLDDFDRLSRSTPVLANIRPSGEYLMEDFYYAGGLPALMAQIKDLLHLERTDCQRTHARREPRAGHVHDDRVIRSRENPLSQHGGLAILRGNLAPDGAVIKHLAASPDLLATRDLRSCSRTTGTCKTASTILASR